MGRTFLAGFAAVLAACFISAPDAVLAKGTGLSFKSTGLVARHALPFRRGITRSSILLPPVVPPFNIIGSAASPRSYSYPTASDRRVFGYGLPVGGIGVYYGPYSDPTDGLDIAGRDCVLRQQLVPLEDGGERRIRILRC